MMSNLMGKKVKANYNTRGTFCIKNENGIIKLREGKIIGIHAIEVSSSPYLIRWDNTKSSFYTREEFDIMSNKNIFKYII